MFAGVLVAVAALLTALLFDEAGVKPFLPPCVFNKATGLYCPGCGGTRALTALLQGRFLDALHCNLLILVLIPVALWFAWRMLVCVVTGVWSPPQIANRRVSVAIAVVFIAFFVLRNVPVWPLTLLVPLPR